MGRLFYFCRRIKHIKIEKYDSKLVRSESEIRESRRRWEREKNVRVVFVGCDVLYGRKAKSRLTSLVNRMLQKAGWKPIDGLFRNRSFLENLQEKASIRRLAD